MPLDPVLIAYAVSRSRKAGAVRWTRIGMAFPHETGAGLTVFLDAVPKDGVVILLERDDDDDERLAAMDAPTPLDGAARPERRNRRLRQRN